MLTGQWSPQYGYQQHHTGTGSIIQHQQDASFYNEQPGDMDILDSVDAEQLTRSVGIDSTDINNITSTVHAVPYAPGQRSLYPNQSAHSRSFPGAPGPNTEPIPQAQKRPRINSGCSSSTTDSAYHSLNVTCGPQTYFPAPTLLGQYSQYHLPQDQFKPEHDQEPTSGSVFSDPGPAFTPHLQVPADGQHKRGQRGSRTQPPPPCACGRLFKNISDSQKHRLQHTKPYHCNEIGCLRREGFATQNDLQRHRSSVHRRVPLVGQQNGYICIACGPPERDALPKFWPRKDNFKAHIKRKHAQWNEAHLIEISTTARPDNAMTAESGYGSAASHLDQLDNGYQQDLPSPVAPEMSGQPSQQGDYSIFDFGNPARGDALVGIGVGAGPLADSVSSREPDTGIYAPDGGYGLAVLSEAAVAIDNLASPLASLLPSPVFTYNDVPHFMVTEHGPGSDGRTHSEATQWSVGRFDEARQSASAASDSVPLYKDEEGYFPCQKCGKKKKRECDLRKHMKRHSRPYGCTFANCYKRFGSRNDWKRHESSQHHLSEMWRCQLYRGDDRRCRKIAYGAGVFRQHLQTQHRDKTRENDVDRLCEYMHLGANAHYRFWCGFCDALIEQNAAEMHAMEIRYKHIGDHYDKDDKDINDWVCIEANKRKGDFSAEDKRRASLRERTGRADDDSDLPDDGMGLPPLHTRYTEPGLSALPSYGPDMAGAGAYNTSSNKRLRLSHPDEDAECVPDDNMHMY